MFDCCVRRGFTVVELIVVLVVIGVTLTLALPRLQDTLDRIAVERSAADLSVALGAARNAAVMWGTRARLVIAADSLRIDRWADSGWAMHRLWPGPADHAVTLEVSNAQVVFGPTGMGWGGSNTKVVLRRGSHSATLTTSRLGRVKRW
jgi:prepilin-type N-terminal cleavage/methylation domain-containing protein